MGPRRPSRAPTWRPLPVVVAAGLTIAACSDAATSGGSTAGDPVPTGSDAEARSSGATTSASVRELPPPVVLDVPDPSSVYDPVRGGEPLPDGFRQVLPRDAIAPVYDPTFVAASGVDWPEDSLVIGVDLDGEARAYPVGFLNRREIVNDNHRGIPTLVTW